MIGKRYILVQAVLVLFAIAIVARLFYWQVIQHDFLVVKAKEQTENTVYISAERGKIFAADKSILVSNEKVYLVYANLEKIKTLRRSNQSYDDLVKEIAEKLSPIITDEKISLKEDPTPQDAAQLKKEIFSNISFQLHRDNVVWVPLAKKVSEKTKEKIASLKIQGIGFQDEYRRYYPEGNIGANLLGFVAKDESGDDKGYFGLEGYYDDKLKGRSGRLTSEVDALGRPILIADVFDSSIKNGLDLYTTIDRTVQFTLDAKLKEGVKKYGAKAGTVLMLDAKTSAVLGMSSVPTFNLNDPSSSRQEDFRNLAVSEVYEPGSTFKIITSVSGLDARVIDNQTICPCQGPIKIGGFEIRTYNNKYHPNSNLSQILVHSDNIGAAFIAEKLGVDRFLDYVKDFGFGQVLGIDLQGEESGILKERTDWKEIDLITGSFGQGLSVTALQMVNAVAAIANDGNLMKPFVVSKIEGNGTSIEFSPTKMRQVVKPQTAALMKQLLTAPVKNAEERKIIPSGYRVAGKTGTAQLPLKGKYSGKTVASFVGFGPVEDPKFAMIVVLHEPSSSIFAEGTAEPLFFSILKDLYPYWGIRVQ